MQHWRLPVQMAAHQVYQQPDTEGAGLTTLAVNIPHPIPVAGAAVGFETLLPYMLLLLLQPLLQQWQRQRQRQSWKSTENRVKAAIGAVRYATEKDSTVSNGHLWSGHGFDATGLRESDTIKAPSRLHWLMQQ